MLDLQRVVPVFARRVRRLAAVLIAISLIAVACGGGQSQSPTAAPSAAAPSAAASPAAPTADPMIAEFGGQQLIDAAIKEGAVTMYAAQIAELMDAQIAAFNKRFPQIKVTYTRQNSAVIDTQIRAEVQAKKFSVDVISNSGDGYMEKYLTELKILGTYKPPTADKYLASDTTNGAWYPISAVVNAFAYNTQLVKAADAPKSWADFLNPAFNGRRSYILPTSDCGIGNVFFTGQVLGLDLGLPYQTYWKALAATKPPLITGSTAQVPSLVSGQNMVSYLFDTQVFAAQATGNQPIEFVYPKEGAAPCWHSTQITADPPHPNAAKLFMNWLLSKEGQMIGIEKFKSFSLRTDMPAPAGVPAGFKVWHYSLLEWKKTHPTWLAEWLVIFDAKP